MTEVGIFCMFIMSNITVTYYSANTMQFIISCQTTSITRHNLCTITYLAVSHVGQTRGETRNDNNGGWYVYLAQTWIFDSSKYIAYDYNFRDKSPEYIPPFDCIIWRKFVILWYAFTKHPLMVLCARWKYIPCFHEWKVILVRYY